MISKRPHLALRIGLFLIALAWFSFTFYEFAFGVVNRDIFPDRLWIFTDIPATLGLGFRTAASFIAVTLAFSYLLKKSFSKPETIMSLRWLILFETANFLSLLPYGYGWLTSPKTPSLTVFLESTLPLAIESLFIPIALLMLFFKLNPNKPIKDAIKWALISGTIYLFVFWLNNMGNWLATAIIKGTNYITNYPINTLSFLLTTTGLLLLALYMLIFSKKSLKQTDITNLNLKKIGYIITIFGLYFLINHILWTFFDTPGGWSLWYAWFFNHNIDLWLLTAPLIGLALIFLKKYAVDTQETKPIRRPLFLLLIQAVGAVYYIAFSASYILAYPSMELLGGQPVFKLLFMVFGTLYLIMVIAALLLDVIPQKPKQPQE